MGMKSIEKNHIVDRAPVDWKATLYIMIRSIGRARKPIRILLVFGALIAGIRAYPVVKDLLLSRMKLAPFDTSLIISYLTGILIGLAFIISYLIIMTTWFQSKRHRRRFVRIGLTNRARQTPVLISSERKNEEYRFEYYVAGIPISMMLDKKEEFESVMNLHISSILQGKNKHLIIVKATKGDTVLPDYIAWDDRYLRDNDNEIVLGINNFGEEVMDLSVTPHVQCGGITGSGKTVLLKNVLYQMRRKGAEIYLADFKGVDFTFKEQEMYHCISEKEKLLELLESLVSEMNRRKELFRGNGTENILKYNQKNRDECIPRIILASDEIAYAFQKKGLKGHDKEVVDNIERNMELIAQQGRAFGIHLWLSTQRGDADTIPPQIRSNLTFRICGRASELLSRVTIDSPAASQIPSSLKGRFVDENDVFFQAFDFHEEG